MCISRSIYPEFVLMILGRSTISMVWGTFQLWISVDWRICQMCSKWKYNSVPVLLLSTNWPKIMTWTLWSKVNFTWGIMYKVLRNKSIPFWLKWGQVRTTNYCYSILFSVCTLRVLQWNGGCDYTGLKCEAKSCISLRFSILMLNILDQSLTLVQ